MDDVSLCQFSAMFLGNTMPLYPYPAMSAEEAADLIDERNISLSERGLKRGISSICVLIGPLLI